jgi:transposase
MHRRIEQLNSHMEQQSIQLRRDKVQELSSQGNSQREISKILQVGIGTVNRDLSYLRQQAGSGNSSNKAAKKRRRK